MARLNIDNFIERNNKKFLVKLWKELGEESFVGGFPLGKAYIDIRTKGDVIDKFYLLIDEAVAKKYPDIAGKYKREL